MKYLKYYVAQQKRMLIFAVGVFPTAMLLFASLVLCVYLLFMKGVFAGETQKYSIGVVGDTDETYLGFGINAVQTLDSTRFVIEFLPMTQEEAREKFLAGEITTYVTIEDGFVDSLVYGRSVVGVRGDGGTKRAGRLFYGRGFEGCVKDRHLFSKQHICNASRFSQTWPDEGTLKAD